MLIMRSAHPRSFERTERNLVSINIAAQRLGVSVFTLRRWIAQRRVPFVRLGRLIRFNQLSLDQFIASNAVETRAENWQA